MQPDTGIFAKNMWWERDYFQYVVNHKVIRRYTAGIVTTLKNCKPVYQ